MDNKESKNSIARDEFNLLINSANFFLPTRLAGDVLINFCINHKLLDMFDNTSTKIIYPDDSEICVIKYTNELKAIHYDIYLNEWDHANNYNNYGSIELTYKDVTDLVTYYKLLQ